MYNDKKLRTGVILTVSVNDIPLGHSHIPFDDIGCEHLGIDMREINKAEIVRVVSEDLFHTRILKDRYGGEHTIYKHKKRST